MDLVDCDDVSEQGVLQEINRRFLLDDIYSSIGPILLAINPYKNLPDLYSDTILEKYVKPCVDPLPDEMMALFPERSELPHVWRSTFAAYLDLRLNARSQAMVISGESGAGKTETTKKCLQLLSLVASRTASTGAALPDSHIEDRILATNPVLEAFGNSKTARNNNSSRFGKWIQVNYHIPRNAIKARRMSMAAACATPQLIGAEITQYLLEKSRVVVHAPEERNYHIFYQLCAAGILDLQPASSYRILRYARNLKIDGVDDAQEFKDTLASMKSLGFSDASCMAIFGALKAILLLGNIVFHDVDTPNSRDSGGAAISHDQNAVMASAAGLLGLMSSELISSLTSRKMTVRGETTTIRFKATQATDALNALAKEIYGRIFSHIVRQANRSLSGGDSERQLIASAVPEELESIGLLDIFGFEKFKLNSFEQLCINFANEKLQQYFLAYVFKREKDLYFSEGIEVDSIVALDNSPVLDVFEQRPDGLFARLDDEVKVPRGSDENFLKKLEKAQSASVTNGEKIFIKDVKMTVTQFEVRHFAGVIRYDVTGFLEKNRDKLYEHLDDLLAKSKVRHFRAMMLGLDEEADGVSGVDDDNSVGTSTSSRTAGGSSATISTRFQGQLTRLMDTLGRSQPHFIKCIKPNSTKAERSFDSEVVLLQLRYSGVLEALQIRRSGFPTRRLLSDFWRQYWMLTPLSRLRIKEELMTDHARCSTIAPLLEKFGDLRVGRTMVFLRQSTVMEMENEKLARRDRAVRFGQCFARRLEAIREFRPIRRAYRALKIAFAEGERYNTSNIAAISSLEVAATGARDVEVPLYLIIPVEEMLHRLYRVRECLLAMGRYVEENCPLEFDGGDAFTHRDRLEILMKSAEELEIQSPAIAIAKRHLEVLRKVCRATESQRRAIAEGDDISLPMIVEYLAELTAEHGEFCKPDITKGNTAMAYLLEDYQAHDKILEALSTLSYALTEATGEPPSDSPSEVVVSATQRFEDQVTPIVTLWAMRRPVAQRLSYVLDAVTHMRALLASWPIANWNCLCESCEAITAGLTQFSDVPVEGNDPFPDHTSYLRESWKILRAIVNAVTPMVSEPLSRYVLVPRLRSAFADGHVVPPQSADRNKISIKPLEEALEIARTAAWVSASVAPALAVVEDSVTLRDEFLRNQFDSLLSELDSAVQFNTRARAIEAWMPSLHKSSRYSDLFLADNARFEGEVRPEDETITDVFESVSNVCPSFAPLFADLVAEREAIRCEALSMFISRRLAEVLIVETDKPSGGSTNSPVSLNILVATAEFGQSASSSIRNESYPTPLCRRLLASVIALKKIREALRSGTAEAIFEAWERGEFDVGPAPSEEILAHEPRCAEAVKAAASAISTAVLSACQQHIERRLTDVIIQHPYSFEPDDGAMPLAVLKGPLAHLHPGDSEVLVRTAEEDIGAKVEQFRMIGSLSQHVSDLATLVAALAAARSTFKRNVCTYLEHSKVLQELLDVQSSLANSELVAALGDSVENEIAHMRKKLQFVRVVEKLAVSLHDKDSALTYLVPVGENTSRRSERSSIMMTPQPQRTKSFSFDSTAPPPPTADLATELESAFMEEGFVASPSIAPTVGQLKSYINNAEQFLEENELEEEICDSFMSLLDGVRLLRDVRTAASISQWGETHVLLKKLTCVFQQNDSDDEEASPSSENFAVLAAEESLNRERVSLFALIEACIKALVVGQPNRDIGFYDYRNVPIQPLTDALEMAESLNISNTRVEFLIKAVKRIRSLREAQSECKWDIINENLVAARNEGLDVMGSVCYHEIKRAYHERDNHDAIGWLRNGIVDEEMQISNGSLDVDKISLKELSSALTRVASMPEDSKGRILRKLAQVADSLLKARRAASGKSWFVVSSVMSVLKEMLEAFQDELDGKERVTRSSIASRASTMRGTVMARQRSSTFGHASSIGSMASAEELIGAAPRAAVWAEHSEVMDSIKREVRRLEHHFACEDLEEKFPKALVDGAITFGEDKSIVLETIKHEELAAIVDRTNEMESDITPLSSTICNLRSVATIVLQIRRAVLAGEWEKMSALLENTLGANTVSWPEASRAEIQLVRKEMENRWIVGNLSSALRIGRLTRGKGSAVAEVSNAHLTSYINTSTSLKPSSTEALRLLRSAQRAYALRETLMRHASADPQAVDSATMRAEWLSLQNDAKNAIEDIKSGVLHASLQEELELMVRLTVDRMVSDSLDRALISGATVGEPGRIDVSRLGTIDLEKAISAAQSSVASSEHAAEMLTVCRTVVDLRKVLMKMEKAPSRMAAASEMEQLSKLLAFIKDGRQSSIDREDHPGAWTICDEEVELIERHRFVRGVEFDLTSSAIRASHVYSARHTLSVSSPKARETECITVLRELTEELDSIVKVVQKASFDSELLQKYLAVATTLRLFRSAVLESDWERLADLLRDKSRCSALNTVEEAAAELRWVACEYQNNVALDILRNAALSRTPTSGDGSIPWDRSMLGSKEFIERSNSLASAVEKAKQFKIGSVMTTAWISACEALYNLRQSLVIGKSSRTAELLMWFKENHKEVPQPLRDEAQAAYVYEQNSLLQSALQHAMTTGKPRGPCGELMYESIETESLRSLLEQAEDIHPLLPEVEALLEGSRLALSIRSALLAHDTVYLQELVDELALQDSFSFCPLVVDEIATARAALDDEIVVTELSNALRSFEGCEVHALDLTFSNTSSDTLNLHQSHNVVTESPTVSSSNAAEINPVEGRRPHHQSILYTFNERRYSFANKNSTSVDPTTIDVDILDGALRVADDHGVFSARAERLYATVRLIRSLRVALRQSDWFALEECLINANFEDNVNVVYSALAAREIHTLRCQLQIRAAVVDLSRSLKRGWAQCSHGIVDSSSMTNDELATSIERADHCIHVLVLFAGGPDSLQEPADVTENDEDESLSPAARIARIGAKVAPIHGESTAHQQMRLLMSSAKVVLEIREELAMGNIETAGEMSEYALSTLHLHHTVVDELKLYAHEINAALQAMRAVERLRVCMTAGRIGALRVALRDALDMELHMGSNLGVVATLAKAEERLEKLLRMRADIHGVLNDCFSTNTLQSLARSAEVLGYHDEERQALLNRLDQLRQFDICCEYLVRLCTLNPVAHSHESMSSVILKMARTYNLWDHPHAKRARLFLSLSPRSLQTITMVYSVADPQYHYAVQTETIRIKRRYLQLSTSQNKYRLELFPLLRKVDDFALRMTVVSAELRRSQLSYTDHALPTSLTRMSAAYASIAVFVFTNLVRGLEKNLFSFPHHSLAQLIRLGQTCEVLRDEILLQLVKQMRQNPDPRSVVRLWQVICACLYFFPPSVLLESYLETFFVQSLFESVEVCSSIQSSITETKYVAATVITAQNSPLVQCAIRLLHRSVFLYGYRGKLSYHASFEDLSEEAAQFLDLTGSELFKFQLSKPPEPVMFSSPQSIFPEVTSDDDNDSISTRDSQEDQITIKPSNPDVEEYVFPVLDLSSDPALSDLTPPPAPTPPVMMSGSGRPPTQVANNAMPQALLQAIQTVTSGGQLTGNASRSAPSTLTAISTISDPAVLVHMRGVRENWISRFLCFYGMPSPVSALQNGTQAIGSYLSRSKFCHAIANSLVNTTKVDSIDRDVFFFLLVGKSMPSRAAIVREYHGDSELFHYRSVDEARSSHYRMEWLRKHAVVGEFASELFFSQLQYSDLVVYAERFWDQIILRMSRECIHFPFLNWEAYQSRDRGTNTPTDASTSLSLDLPSSVDETLITWELYRELVVVGMAKYLEQFTYVNYYM